MASQDNDISILNSLIETTIDSADGYKQAADTARNETNENSHNVGLADMFHQFGIERQSVVADLRSQVISLGGEPEDDGTLLAGAHRSFLRLKSLFGSSRERLIEEVESGEDHIKDKYEDALKNDLSPSTRMVVERAFQSVRAGHDTVSAMKHANKNH